ncbi:MAG: SusC/RagA family TonB-linked outer membrane protein [Marinilabiliaceae bacterium]|nr:SusC/RagA family TonB-linked outer membrane protein [Marinilabiliaceae bacterium]
MNVQYNKQKGHIRFLSMFLFAFCLGSIASAQDTEGVGGANTAAESQDSTTVNVAFRKMLASDLLGGVNYVNVADLTEKSFAIDAMNGMKALVPGMTSTGFLWGFDNYLVLIDGVPGRELNNIRPDEIAEITFMKGAQAVLLYGSHAAKGAVLVTTKRGDSSEAIKIQARVNTGWRVHKAYPEYLGSAEYMVLYNEARANEGEEAYYSNDDIYNSGLGKNPYRYPSVNFYSDEFIKKAYNRTEGSLEISGGGERAKYYTNVSYYHMGSQFKFGEAKDNFINRLNVRGNVDMIFSKMLSAYVNANVALYNDQTPTTGNYWDEASKLRPNRVAPLIPISYLNYSSPSVATEMITARPVDGKYILGGVKTQQESNIFADYYVSGNKTFSSRQMQFDTGLDFDFSSLLKGLSFHIKYALDYQTNFTTKYENKYVTYQPTWSTQNGKDEVLGLEPLGTYSPATAENVSDSKSNLLMAANAHFDYNNSFGDHNVSAIVVANGDQLTETGEYHRKSAANLAALVNYNFAHRYYLNAGVSVTHTAKLHEDNRKKAGYSVELGWNAAKESILEGSIFDDLIVSAAYSSIHTDLDITKYYLYAGNFKISDDWWNWDGGTGVKATNSRNGANPDLDYINRKEISANLKLSLMEKALSFEGSFFKNEYNGGIISADFLFPSYFTKGEATFNSQVNYNEDTRYGFDFSVNYKKAVNSDLKFEFGANGVWYYAESTKRDDSKIEEDYRKKSGKDLYANWGYECLGFFNSQEEIKGWANQKELAGEDIRPGDLKYKDQNNDGVINEKDKILLSRTVWDSTDGVNQGGGGAPLTLGAHFTAKYKGFTLFVLGSGNFGAEGVKNSSYYWVAGDNKYSAVVRDRWTEQTKNTAKYPRLTTKKGTNNFQTSTFWTYKADRFDIERVQLTYDFSEDMIGGTILSGAQVYLYATDLVTFAKEREHMEMNVGSAPQTRSYNIGVKVTF